MRGASPDQPTSQHPESRAAGGRSSELRTSANVMRTDPNEIEVPSDMRGNRSDQNGAPDANTSAGRELDEPRQNEADASQGGPPRPTRRKIDRLARKTGIRVASLNMNGYGALHSAHPDNKWRTMYKNIKQNGVGILLLQETHLTESRKADVMGMFKGRLKIFFSEHPDAPTRKEGVAVVLNKSQINANGATATEIVPGRALQVTVLCAGETNYGSSAFTPPHQTVLKKGEPSLGRWKNTMSCTRTSPDRTLWLGTSMSRRRRLTDYLSNPRTCL